MHILIDLQACQAPGSRNRGIGRYSLALAKAMIAEGRDRHHFSLLLSDRFPEAVASLRDEFSPLMDGGSIHVMALPGSVEAIGEGAAARIRAAEILRAGCIRALEPDVVHVASAFEGLTDPAVVSVDAGPDAAPVTAVTLYDLIPYLKADHYLASPLARAWYLRRLQQVSSADLLLAISESSRQEALAVLDSDPAAVVSIAAAVDDDFYRPPAAAEHTEAVLARYGIRRPYVMYTGGNDTRKNIVGLVEAFAQLPPSIRNGLQLAVVCDMPEAARDALEKRAGELGLEAGDLVFTGYVSDEDLRILYGATDLFVFPSLHEGFGLPALEAMACGAPTIGSDSSSIPEVIGLPEALFDPADAGAIAECMARALTDDGFRDRLRENAGRQAAAFSWRRSAHVALDAMERVFAERERQLAPRTILAPAAGKKPRLAFVSPLPPDRSGIADYSAQLLPSLARFYDIELVFDGDTIDDPQLTASFAVRSPDWFLRHYRRYDRVLYQMGNSQFHVLPLRLLQQVPGVVVLHDYSLGGLMRYRQETGEGPQVLLEAIIESHGIGAGAEAVALGPGEASLAFPANGEVLDRAVHVLVHSRFSRERVVDDYGRDLAHKVTTVPFPAPRPSLLTRAEARERLGLDGDVFVVCSFGIVAQTKCTTELLEAWRSSGLAGQAACRLVLVGACDPGAYGSAVAERLQGLENAENTGFAAPGDYDAWLAAADVAVQLRRQTRGETSAAIFDCLARPTALVYNAHGTAAELPAGVGWRLPDEFSTAALAEALVTLHENPAQRSTLREAAAEHAGFVHARRLTARAYRDAIEGAWERSPVVAEARTLDAAADALAEAPPGAVSPAWLAELARAAVRNRRDTARPRLWIETSRADREVLEPILLQLVERVPAGWRLECCCPGDAGDWRADRRWLPALRDCELAEPEVGVSSEDCWLQLADNGAGAANPDWWQTPALHAGRAAELALDALPEASACAAGILAWVCERRPAPVWLRPLFAEQPGPAGD